MTNVFFRVVNVFSRVASVISQRPSAFPNAEANKGKCSPDYLSFPALPMPLSDVAAMPMKIRVRFRLLRRSVPVFRAEQRLEGSSVAGAPPSRVEAKRVCIHCHSQLVMWP